MDLNLPPNKELTFMALRADEKEVRKAFFWTPDRDGAKEWLNAETPDEVGRWSEDLQQKQSAVNTKRWYLKAYLTPDMPTRLKLRRALADGWDANGGIIQGVAVDDLRPHFIPSGNIPLLNWTCTKIHAKSGRWIKDDAKRFFLIDVDGFDLSLVAPGFDVINDEEEIPAVLADLFDMCGLDWLIADTIIHLSSSHGTKPNKSILNAHVEFELKEHLTLKQQKTLAEFINRRVVEKFNVPFIDTSVYDPPRIFYTNAPRFTRLHYGQRPTDAAHRMRVLSRVHYINHGQPFLNVDDDVLNSYEFTEALKPAHLRKAAAPVDTTMRPHHTHIPVRNATAAIAMKTPMRHLAIEIARIQGELREEIMSLPGDEQTLAKREKRTSINSIVNYTMGMLEKRMARSGMIVQEARKFALQMPIADVRFDLQLEMKSQIEEGLTKGDGAFFWRPSYTLFKVPAGVGKSHAALASVDVDRLYANRISYLTPTIKLGKEIQARYLKKTHTDEERDLVRHNRGRKDLCLMKAEVQGKACDRLEKAGMSPVVEVCGRCPKRDVCKYPAQQSYKGPGLIIGQHQHAVTSMKRTTTSTKGAQQFQIIDESILDTVMPDAKRRSIHKLIKDTSKVSHRGLHTTADIRGYRTELLTLIKSHASHLLMTRDLHALRRTVTIKRGEQEMGMEAYRAALMLERDFANELRKRLGAETRNGLEEYAKKGHGKYKRHDRASAKILGELATAEWFVDVWRAIEASMDTPNREYVFGIRMSKGGSLAVRIRKDLPDIFGEISGMALDATADPELFKTIMRKSNVDVRVREYEVLPGPYTLYQYTDKPYSLRMFMQSDEANSNIAQMVRFIRLKSIENQGSVLVVAQKPIADKLRELAPDIAAYEHFKNLKGIDRYKDRRCIIVIGRHMPPKAELELMTEVVHYDSRDCPWLIEQEADFHSETRYLRRAGHTMAYQIQAESHPDPRVAAIMRQQGEVEVQQAVNRLRLYDRTADNPAEIHVFGQSDTLLDVTAVLDWTHAQVREVDFALASGLVVPVKGIEVKTLADHFPEASDSTRLNAMKKASKLIAAAKESSVYESVLALKRNTLFHSYYSNLQELEPIGTRNYSSWSVRMSGRRKACTVWVDAKQHGEQPDQIKELIERETGQEVVSLDLHSLSLGS